MDAIHKCRTESVERNLEAPATTSRLASKLCQGSGARVAMHQQFALRGLELGKALFQRFLPGLQVQIFLFQILGETFRQIWTEGQACVTGSPLAEVEDFISCDTESPSFEV